MARTVNGGNAAPQQPIAAPEGVVIDMLPGSPGAEALSPEGAKSEYKYKPSEKTLRKLDEFKFWPQVKERFGLDIEAVKKDARTYGVLEGLAYGGFTSEPLFLKIKSENQKAVKGFFTVRLYTNPETGDWGIETHKVGLKLKTDKDGNYIQAPGKPAGEYLRTFDRNPIKEGDVLFFDGNALSKEETDHLRLTGALGKVLSTVKFDGTPVHTIVCPDPYNQHELVGLSSEMVRKRLFTENGRVFKDNGLTYEPNDKQLGEIAVGQIIECAAKEDPQKKAYLMYDTARGQMRKTVSYEYALKKELARKEQEAIGKKLAKEHAQAQRQAQGSTR